MPSITAVLHTKNDALRLGRCLETLYPCDHILVVDHGSCDGTVELAREYSAQVVAAAPGTWPAHYLHSLAPAWMLCLDPRESLSESLAASLYEWKLLSAPASAHSVFLREETDAGWADIPTAQTRLVPASWNRWDKYLPVHDPSSSALDGPLLRFDFP